MSSPSSVIDDLDLVSRLFQQDSYLSFSLDEVLSSLNHRSVRDLAWVIGTPSILSQDLSEELPADDFYMKMLNMGLPILATLDKNPKPLDDFLARSKSKRLGLRFERFWQFWLHACKGWSVVASDYQMSNSSRTIGAFDLLIQEQEKQGLSHWELAVKFYLNTGAGSRMSDWHGPNKVDRLDKKINRMMEHQLKLSRYPSVKQQLVEKNWNIKRTKAIVKGRLFWNSRGNKHQLPNWANPYADRGFWCTATEFESIQQRDQLEWFFLEKDFWLSPVLGDDLKQLKALSDNELMKIPDLIRQAFHIVGCDLETQKEVKRGFLVPDNWLESIED